MKLFIFLLAGIFSALSWWLQKTDIRNALAHESSSLFQQRRYPESANRWNELYKIDSTNSMIQLNLAHALYKAYQLNEAATVYTNIVTHSEPHIRSIAQHQLGCILYRSKKYQQALFYFKEALLSNPSNRQASFNYELIRHYLKSNASDPSTGSATSSSPSSSTGNSNGKQQTANEKGDQQADSWNRRYYHRQATPISRAEKILHHLEEQEIQYLHQHTEPIPPAPNGSQW